jgi:hypothetical protein
VAAHCDEVVVQAPVPLELVGGVPVTDAPAVEEVRSYLAGLLD